MSAQGAPDDVVETWERAAEHERPPLLVLAPLVEQLERSGVCAGSVSATPVGDGHSNVTFLLEPQHGEAVIVRRPPRPPLPPSAHDVLREARLLRALEGTPARVPRVLCVCEDESVIGAPFYVMERVVGDVITNELPPALDDPAQRARIADELLDALAEVHGVDWRAAGLEGFGKPTGYLERQLRRFLGLWEINRTREIPEVERVGKWLADNLPESGPATIVHGDYRLGNVMFAPGSPARLAAIFDWEMATIGDPLADVGYMCTHWIEAADPPRGMFELGSVTRREGFPTRAELIAGYEQRTGRAMGDIRWYTTLAIWKAIVFMEGNYKRAVAGATDDPYLKAFGDGVIELARRAEETALGG